MFLVKGKKTIAGGACIKRVNFEENQTYPLIKPMLKISSLVSSSGYALGSANMELHTEYLNRVRMNTIEGNLIFLILLAGSAVPALLLRFVLQKMSISKKTFSIHYI